MDSSLTPLSTTDDPRKIVDTLRALLEDPSKRGCEDIWPVARQIVHQLIGRRPVCVAATAEVLYVVLIAEEVINPATPGLQDKINQYWKQARACYGYSADLEFEYFDLRIKAHRIRADRMKPDSHTREQHEACIQDAEQRQLHLVAA